MIVMHPYNINSFAGGVLYSKDNCRNIHTGTLESALLLFRSYLTIYHTSSVLSFLKNRIIRECSEVLPMNNPLFLSE